MKLVPALALALCAVGCKSKSKEEPAAALDAAAKVAPPATSDAGAVATATVDAAAAAPTADAMPARPAQAGTLYLVEGHVVLGELDAAPAVAEGGRVLFLDPGASTAFEVTRPLPAPDPAYASVVGQRLALWGKDGKECTATVGGILAVGAGTSYDLRGRKHEPEDTPDLVATATAAATTWYAAGDLVDITGKCEDEMFAVPETVKPKLVKVSAAKDWEDAAEAAYDETDWVQEARAKVELEGSGSGVKMISVRKLKAATGPSLALVYASLNDKRTIGVFSVPGPTFEGAKFLGSVDAPAPSEVVGGDLDGDGLLDVVVSHLSGLALVRGNGEGLTLVDGWLADPL